MPFSAGNPKPGTSVTALITLGGIYMIQELSEARWWAKVCAVRSGSVPPSTQWAALRSLSVRRHFDFREKEKSFTGTTLQTPAEIQSGDVATLEGGGMDEWARTTQVMTVVRGTIVADLAPGEDHIVYDTTHAWRIGAGGTSATIPLLEQGLEGAVTAIDLGQILADGGAVVRIDSADRIYDRHPTEIPEGWRGTVDEFMEEVRALDPEAQYAGSAVVPHFLNGVTPRFINCTQAPDGGLLPGMPELLKGLGNRLTRMCEVCGKHGMGAAYPGDIDFTTLDAKVLCEQHARDERQRWEEELRALPPFKVGEKVTMIRGLTKLYLCGDRGWYIVDLPESVAQFRPWHVFYKRSALQSVHSRDGFLPGVKFQFELATGEVRDDLCLDVYECEAVDTTDPDLAHIAWPHNEPFIIDTGKDGLATGMSSHGHDMVPQQLEVKGDRLLKILTAIEGKNGLGPVKARAEGWVPELERLLDELREEHPDLCVLNAYIDERPSLRLRLGGYTAGRFRDFHTAVERIEKRFDFLCEECARPAWIITTPEKTGVRLEPGLARYLCSDHIPPSYEINEELSNPA